MTERVETFPTPRFPDGEMEYEQAPRTSDDMLIELHHEIGKQPKTRSARLYQLHHEIADHIDGLRAEVAALNDDDAVFGKYGNCPVQIERTVGDRQFYFRARGELWSLCVGAAGDMSEFAAVDGEEILSGKICVPFIAGWMPAKLAEALTDWGIDAWTRQQSGEFERNAKEVNAALDAARGAGA